LKNNQIFRAANERIRAKAEEYDSPLERIPFICECAREDCVQIVRLTASEYAAVRANPRQYFTAPGHEVDEHDVGRAVTHEQGYVIVEQDLAEAEG
jgi:hypothetical protein